MSVSVILRCDGCGTTGGDYGWRNVAEMREGLTEIGWTHPKRGVDYCPDCED